MHHTVQRLEIKTYRTHGSAHLAGVGRHDAIVLLTLLHLEGGGDVTDIALE